MALITAEQLADELHIDQSPEELATLGTLIKDASAIIRGSIDSQLAEQVALELASEQFNRLVAWHRHCTTIERLRMDSVMVR